MQLSNKTISNIEARPGLEIPAANLLALPEKVIQFGTGVLLRALPDYFIDKANRQGIFNGRIVVVKSTSGATVDFEEQDNLYTVCVRGIDKDVKVQHQVINSSISRVLAAKDEWDKILECAKDPNITIIISNTTEIGIVMSDDNVTDKPPASFPGKLLAMLHTRYQSLGKQNAPGCVIVPTELITDNGRVLQGIITKLAGKNELEDGFIKWLGDANHFCSSLVDRIVPGSMSPASRQVIEEEYQYKDDLMIMAESFRLWAIEGDEKKIGEILSFAKADDGVVIASDIEKFRELKLRLLNGTHTFSCGLALHAGFTTVREAMQDAEISGYIKRLMMLEIAKAVSSGIITYNEACAFANSVMDRFRNPFLEHKWKSIAVNFTSKMKLRNVPLIARYIDATGEIPLQMAMGFAAYILALKPGLHPDIQDEHLSAIHEHWNKSEASVVVPAILSDKAIWDNDLAIMYPGFAEKVRDALQHLLETGMEMARENKLNKSTA